eukprot:366142-Chlamydomonas_euryale.AAC.10
MAPFPEDKEKTPAAPRKASAACRGPLAENRPQELLGRPTRQQTAGHRGSSISPCMPAVPADAHGQWQRPPRVAAAAEPAWSVIAQN